jgi:predicted RND superfamily exporter protein
MRFFSNIILRRAGLIAFLGTLLAFVGLFYTVQLYKNLRTDFEELLPTTARSVVDLKEVTSRLESIDNLGVLIFSKSPDASKRFVNDLAHELEKEPKSLISSVEYKIDRELQFFKERQALYMDLSDLLKVRNYIEDRIDYEKELYNPLNIFREEDIPEPKLDFKAMRQKYDQKASSYSRFPGGYYATPDGTKRVILVYKPGGSGMDASIALKAAVTRAVAQINPKSYSPDLEVHYTGGVQDQIEEHDALIADLELSTVIVTIIVTLAMLLFFRNVRATMALVLSLFMGTFWTFGASYFAVGYLNANSAFLGSIVIGNGINFGIIFLARYLEERRRGRHNARAIRLAITHTSTSTWTAALAAGLSYGSLILTGFRGFKQFGIIGLIGMVLCWVSAFTLLPAYLIVLDRISPLIKRGGEKPPRQYLTGAVAVFVQRAPLLIWGAAFFVTLISLSMLTRYTPKILETDLSKLRNKESMEHGSAYLSKYLDEIFQRYLSPNVVLPKSRDDARKIAEVLKEKKIQQGKDSMIATVQTLDDFVPGDQYDKIKVIKEIRSLLSPRIVRRLSDEDQQRVTEYLTNASLKPVKMDDLPHLVLSKFTEKDGTVGKLVLVEPPLTHETWEGSNIIRMVRELRDVSDSVKPGTAVAGTLAITSDMIEAVSHDGPRATMFAFMAVVILVVFLFRNVQAIALTLFALILGVIWLAGIVLGFGIKINFLNFIALPITFGIGVDYGVNVFQRYREERGGNIINVIRNTGGAVGLSSFTTITGYMSLLIAGNQGFVSFGTLAVAGELTCVIAAVVALPAYLILRQKRRGEAQLL